MKKLFSLVASLVMMLSLVACGGSNSNSIVYGCEELSGTFLPTYYSSSYDGHVVDLVHDKLLARNYEGELVPSLAKEMPTITNDGKDVTFKLRDDVKFSNGSKLTAKDVKFTYSTLADPSYTGRYGTQVMNMVGYDEFNKGTTTDFAGIEVVDDYTVTFHFVEGYRTNLTDCVAMGIMSSKQFKDYKPGNTKYIEKQMKKPVGTGPYVLDSWSASTGAVLNKSESYWGKGYEIEKVIIKPVKMETDYEEIKKGNIDMLQSSIEPSKVGPASKNKEIGMNSYPRAGLGYISLNAANPTTQDKEVRQALLYAFDRQAFVDSYFYTKELKDTIAYAPTTYQNPVSVIGEVVRGEEAIEGFSNYTYNIEKAKSLLDSAGWVVGADGIREKNGQKLSINIIAMEQHDICNTLVPMWQKEWGDNLGMDVKVATVDFNTLVDKITTDEGVKEWNVFFLATSFTGDDPGDIYSSFHSSQAKAGGDNYPRLQDNELDALLDQAKTVSDPAAVKDIYSQIAVKVNDDAVMLPVYGNTYYDMYRKDRVTNYKTSPLYPWTSALRDVKLK